MKGINGLFVNSEKFAEITRDRIRVKREKSLRHADKVIKDLRINRNWSWFRELKFRNADNLDDVALFYRGNEITYREMFEKMETYAKSLKAMGVKERTEVPICMSNSPEFVYILGAISMIGAYANVFANDFDEDYVEEILKGCSNKVLFIEDNKYERIKNIIGKVPFEKIVMPSLADSLPDGKDPYAEYDEPFKELFNRKVPKYKEENSKVIGVDEFEKIGEGYEGDLVNTKVTLDTPFTISYSSGTTSNRPKGIIHSNMSYNGVTRFHDKEVNHTPSYKMFQMQATIPTFSSTDLMSGISDALLQGCRLALEPIYDENFVIESLLINQPSYLDLTKSFWMKFAKDILNNPKYENVEMPFLTICFSVGEPTELNEEKLINKAFKKVKAGRKMIPVPLPIIKLSVAGGDCEHGGIFYRLLRHYANMKPLHRKNKEPAGMGVFDAVDVAVLDENGGHCAPYQVGNLVATSPFDMLGYKNNVEATKKFFIKDAQGRGYGDLCCDAYQDYQGYIHFVGRNKGGVISAFSIAIVILKDLKDVLSCEVVESDGMFIAHVELVPGCKDVKAAFGRIDSLCEEILGHEISSKIVYRLHTNEESFKLTHSGKRDKLSLIAEGVSEECFKPIYADGQVTYIPASQYIHEMNDEKQKIFEK